MVGDRIKTIKEVDLLLEIEKLAVEKQSNLVHTVALMSATQERDEGVRQYVARLRGLAAVCDLNIEVKCSCNSVNTVSTAFYYIELIKLALWKSGTTTWRSCMRDFQSLWACGGKS